MGDIFSIISKKFNRLFADFKLENNANKSEKKYGVRSDRNDGPNGEIDESIFQKNTGDCWLLASVLSLNESKKGKEMLKNAISKNENGNWEVYFNGLDKSYEVTQEQLDKYNKKPGVFYSKYTTGDDDMLLIELATEKLIKEEKDNENVGEYIRDGIDGGTEVDFFKIFAGTEAEEMDFEKFINEDYEVGSDSVLTFGSPFNCDDNLALSPCHAYSIKNIDRARGIIELINPWDSTKDFNLNIKSLPKESVITSMDGFMTKEEYWDSICKKVEAENN